MAHIAYPQGMACARRIQNSIDYLHKWGDFSIRVLILRKTRVPLRQQPLSGYHHGCPYTTIGTDVQPGAKLPWAAWKYYRDGCHFLDKHYRHEVRNIIYIYGYPDLDTLPLAVYAKRRGYRLCFDIVEDIDVQEHAPDFLARLKHWSAQAAFRRIGWWADMILVITNHLRQKTRRMVQNKIPVHLFPITVDLQKSTQQWTGFHRPVQVFYGGTFAEKDDLENLIKAFDMVATRHADLELVLTGRAANERLEQIQRAIDSAQHRDRVFYRGYLDEQAFYATLNKCDIPCMVRTGSAFADRGFPFKLGEYLATGKPVIASAVSDVRDFLRDRENAMLVPPDSAEALAAAMEYLLGNEQHAVQIGRRGKQTAHQHFNAAVQGERLRQLLMEL